MCAGAEGGLNFLQVNAQSQGARVRAAEHASRGPLRVLERRYGLAEIVERGVVVFVERLHVTPTNREREIMAIPENASRHGHHLTQPCLGFCVALQTN